MNKKQMVRWFLWLVAGLALTACGTKPTITLVENPWLASELNNAVARILLEEELGYTVNVVALDGNDQWTAVADGTADVSLEVWSSGHKDDIAHYINETQSVENGGPLGPIGKIGWYVPSYMVEQIPTLYSWEGFQDPNTAALFATEATAPNGQFLAGDPSYVQYDADIIRNLHMNLQVVMAGSEEALLAQLDTAYQAQKPIVFYFWTPHYALAKYKLTQVELPAHTDECYAQIDSGGVDCDYPADELFKIFSPALKEKAPEAYTFLHNMNYATEDQITMMAAVKLDGKTVEEAARQWLADNPDIWHKWLP